MAGNNGNASVGGIGFVGLLTVAFIVLKLTRVINWSWWWVLAPIWISMILGVVIFLITFGIYLAYQAREDRKKGVK